jgi:hypothetical protein
MKELATDLADKQDMLTRGVLEDDARAKIEQLFMTERAELAALMREDIHFELEKAGKSLPSEKAGDQGQQADAPDPTTYTGGSGKVGGQRVSSNLPSKFERAREAEMRNRQEKKVTQDANSNSNSRHCGLAAQGRDIFVGTSGPNCAKSNLKLTIERGSSLAFRLHVPPNAGKISWEFTSSGGEIGYGSMFAPVPDEEVQDVSTLSTSRVNSHEKVVEGSTSNSTGGQLIIKFDNSFSRWKSKTVKLQLRSDQKLVWSHFGKRQTAVSTVNGGAMAAFAVPTAIAGAVAGPAIAGAMAARGAVTAVSAR